MAARSRILITLAWAKLSLHGRDPALDLLDQVRDLTDAPRLRALSRVQEAVIHVACQDWAAALAALDHVGPDIALLTPRERTAALLNAGLAHLSLLELAPARADLGKALALAIQHSLPEQEFKARHNLGCLEYYAGQLPDAIRLMRAADAMDVPVGRVRAQHDLALVLLEAGLLDQAREILGRALSTAQADRNRLEEADLRLDLATTALLRDDHPAARAHLDAAVAAYRARGARERQRSTALLRASVDLAAGAVPRALHRTLAPWSGIHRPVTPDERLAVRVEVEAHLLKEEVHEARYAAERLRGSARQGLGAAMHDQLLMAKVAAAQGDRVRARRIVRRALEHLTARQAPTQSMEIRSALALHGHRLAEFELDEALGSGAPSRVFDAVERWRAISYRLAPVSPPADDGAAVLLRELRQARRAASDPQADRGTARARVAELEWAVSQTDWARADDGTGGQVASATTARQARASLVEQAKDAVVFFVHDDTQHAIVFSPNGLRLHVVGTAAEVSALTDRLSRDLRAHAFASTNPALRAAVGRAVADSLSALDRHLVRPLGLDPGSELVVVPGRTLMSVPWSMVPSLAGRPVTVTPSMTRWTGPSAVPPARRPLLVTALAGPRLLRSGQEVDDVVAAWDGTGSAGRNATPSATTRDVTDALASADVVHLAAHGTHEPQNPWFSGLEMADGPVFAHELPRSSAQHVVLSACDVGRLDPRPGDEPLGLTAALLALGARSVVAPVAPVPDEAAAGAMAAYHRLLARGGSAAGALAETLTEHPAAGAFCLYGSEWRADPGQIQSAGSRNIAS